jgi:mannose/cellobiose epimerase-like protein (N-acyl-D-glucosamine 2-epimerase family)
VLLPFWAERAWSSEGGFVAELTPEGSPVSETMRSCLVQARLLYTFSHAVTLGGGAWAWRAAEQAHTFMLRRLATEAGAWRHAAGPHDDGPADDLVDFYDQAFVLFGLAWWHRAAGDASALDLARATLAYLERHLADRVHGGYREASDGRGPRRQNPHMHLLEAMHAWFEATGDEAWLVRARALVRLFQERFYDDETGTLREFFADDLLPAPGAAGLVREPGHHMEWVWLLLHHRRLTGDDAVLTPARRLFETARQNGVNSRGLLVEEMAPDGRVLTPSTLLWPQTEAVKASVARLEFGLGDPAEVAFHLGPMMKEHLPDCGPLWINHLSPGGVPLSTTVPTRLLYHLTLCLAEVDRVVAPTVPRQ